MLTVCLAVLPGPGQAMPPGADIAASVSSGGVSRLLQRVDTFPACVQQRRCSTDRNGRQRCGDVERCQECSYQKQCDRQGCQWRQVCNWGPFKPVLKTN